MAEDDNPAAPASPDADGRADRLPDRPDVRSTSWREQADRLGSERHLIGRVPWRLRGAGRRVYPGFLQLSAFMSMNRERHVEAFRKYFPLLVAGERPRPRRSAISTTEYMAVADLPAEFYLETVRLVFQEYVLPRSELFVGERGDQRAPSAARRCSPSRASATTSARSARPWRRRI